jgi:hypothetical protein
VAGLFSLLNRLFPHRQFYLRSRGSVTFFEFSPTFQMTVAFGSLVFLCWVGYASVVVIFKEQIISAKDQRYASMQDVYESKISQQQLAYDELNGLLVLAEERFQNATRDLEAKHRQLTALLMQKQAMDKKFIGLKRQVADMGRYGGPTFAKVKAPSDGSNIIPMQTASVEPARRQGRSQQTISGSAIGTVIITARGQGQVKSYLNMAQDVGTTLTQAQTLRAVDARQHGSSECHLSCRSPRVFTLDFLTRIPTQ